MNFLLGLVIGLLVGLLLNWVISPLFDRSGQQLTRQETEITRALDGLEQRLQAVERVLTEGKAGDEAQPGGHFTQVIVRRSDDLEKIKGIGPAFSQRLKEAGIHTFRELAASSPERIKQIVGAEELQDVDVETWLRMAHHLADESAARVQNGR
jgi:predicted flap endonuclease-1-like 5' DNA nuclease